jgi:hypothetical protein
MPVTVSPPHKYKANDISPILGYREGNNITAEDRITNISSLALMMKNDLLKLHEACNYLSEEFNTDTQSKAKQFLKRLSLVKAGILTLSEYSEDILDLTHKKASATYNAKREKTFNTYQMKMEKQLEKQKKSYNLRNKKEPTEKEQIFAEIKRIGTKRNSITKKRISSRHPYTKPETKKRKVIRDICDDNCPYTFHLSKGVVKLDPPKHSHNFYTLRELVGMLHDVIGHRKSLNHFTNREEYVSATHHLEAMSTISKTVISCQPKEILEVKLDAGQSLSSKEFLSCSISGIKKILDLWKMIRKAFL